MDLHELSRCVKRHARKIVLMQLLPGLCLLGWVSVWAQTTPPNLQLESRAPSLFITSTGQNGAGSSVQVKNPTGLGVTGLALRGVPAAVTQRNGMYDCAGRCSLIIKVADKARPVIRAGGTLELSLDSEIASGGVIILESALFDDGTYQGNERSAAALAARQIGNQAEYDRIVSVLGAILSGNEGDDSAKASRALWKLSELTIGLTPETIRKFKAGFPDLHDCDHRYARAIKRASAAEKSYAVDKLRQFIAGQYPAGTSLARWWELTSTDLNHLGCAGCASVPIRPQPSHATPVVFRGCHVPPGPAPVAGGGEDPGGVSDDLSDDDMPPDGLLDDDAELGPDDDLGPDDAVDVETDVPAPAVIAAAPRGPVYKVPPKSSRPVPSAAAPQPGVARVVYPFPNVAGYSSFLVLFSLFSHETRHQGLSPLSGLVAMEQQRAGLTDQEAELVLQAAEPCYDANEKIFAALRKFLDKYAVGESMWVPRPPEFRELEIRKAKIVAAQVRVLRKQLGETSFDKLDQYVAVHYTSPGPPFRFQPIDTYWRYFHYLVNLDSFALRDRPEDLKGGPLRVRAQDATGLNDEQWKALVEMATEYERDIRTKPHFEPQPAQGLAGHLAVPTPSPVRSTTAAIGALPPTSSAQRFSEPKAARAERTRVWQTYMERLKLKIGAKAFKQLDAYVQRSYNTYTPVPSRAAKAATPAELKQSPPRFKSPQPGNSPAGTKQTEPGTGVPGIRKDNRVPEGRHN